MQQQLLHCSYWLVLLSLASLWVGKTRFQYKKLAFFSQDIPCGEETRFKCRVEWNHSVRISEFSFRSVRLGLCVFVCTNTHSYCQENLQKVLPRISLFSYSLAFFILATGCAQLSRFGSSSRLWGQILGIGGEDQLTFSNADDGPAPHPLPFSTLSWLPALEQRRKKNKTAIWWKPAAAAADSGWGLGVYSICLCFISTPLLPFPSLEALMKQYF